jgi:hypothetical protein
MGQDKLFACTGVVFFGLLHTNLRLVLPCVNQRNNPVVGCFNRLKNKYSFF